MARKLSCAEERELYRSRRRRRTYWKTQRKPSARRRAMLLALTPLVVASRRRVEKCDRAEVDPVGFGVDYAFLPHPSMGTLKGAGTKFVARYLSNVDPRAKDTTKTLGVSEASELRRNGFPIVLVFETSAGRATDGKAAGAKDARTAIKHAGILGAPADTALYFAVDFDADPREVVDYFEGVRAVAGDRAGAYGGIRVIDELFRRKLIDYGWQTLAWSGGEWSSRAQLRQYAIEKVLGGCDVDFNKAVSPRYGAWG